MAITEKMYLYNDILLDNKTALGTISSQLTAHSSQLTAHSSQLTAHSSQLTAHSSQLTAHSSQSLVLIKIISCFIIINLSTKRAVSEFGAFSHFILWLLFFLCFASGVSTVFCETK